MTAFRKIAAALIALAALGTTAPAFADSHMIEANSTSVIEFYACGEFFLVAPETTIPISTFSSLARLAGSFMRMTIRRMSP